MMSTVQDILQAISRYPGDSPDVSVCACHE
jgi:hypothetical protein